MWEVASWRKDFIEDEMKDLSELCKISDAVQERDMVAEGEWR